MIKWACVLQVPYVLEVLNVPSALCVRYVLYLLLRAVRRARTVRSARAVHSARTLRTSRTLCTPRSVYAAKARRSRASEI